MAERTRVANRMKSALARLGIRGLKPERRRAPQRLAALRTPEGLAMPPNTLDETLRDSPTADVLEAIVDLDLAALADTEPPRGYGRD